MKINIPLKKEERKVREKGGDGSGGLMFKNWDITRK